MLIPIDSLLIVTIEVIINSGLLIQNTTHLSICCRIAYKI